MSEKFEPVGTVVPPGIGKHEIRVLKVVVAPAGEPIFSEMATAVEIDDEAAGEFVRVTKEGGGTELKRSIAIADDEWPALRAAIDFMIGQCRPEQDDEKN